MREPQPYRLRPEAVSFLDLPAEIRTDIYGYYMPQPITLGRRYDKQVLSSINEKPCTPYTKIIATNHLDVKETSDLPDINLLRTCKQIRQEASNVLHGCTAHIRVSVHDLDLVTTRLGGRIAEIESLTVFDLPWSIRDDVDRKTACLVNATGLKKLIVQWRGEISSEKHIYQSDMTKFLGAALLPQLRMRFKNNLPWKSFEWTKELVHLEGAAEKDATRIIDQACAAYLNKALQMRLMVMARKEAKALAEAGQS